ncbi:MotA/TolQ/ExbB proton channel family protein [Shewanella chilikensis]|uniref:MotA/TolQ/ExbB proton channel family protein n=1 Tax=Shewanella chilikensis TaxID=558541 RepID=UPI001F2C71ED|nr:MotA/TolQ/ExbB proton channel family protein [Shewanella chilikensis]MCE9787771.1 MotA/TolQ/ExbB proton channel family protein [Shewanella chilikensis]
MSAFYDFVLQAGVIVWLILLLSCLMWYLLLKGFSRIRRLSPRWRDDANQLSARLAHYGLWQKAQLQQAFLSRAALSLSGGLDWIDSLIKILPLLGLLGTVDGMISSFAELGQLDVQKQLSSGISSALLTTLAGLVTSLSGLYLAYQLKQSNQRLLAELRRTLSE